MTVERDEGFRAGVARDEALRALEIIRGHADADDPTSYRSDDREGCLDAIYTEADRALKYIALLPANAGQPDGGVEDDDPCAGGTHCCCCGPGEACCDCGRVMPSATCAGEKCWCGEPAAKKVGEEIAFDDPIPERHNLTAYVCAFHYAQMMGPAGARQIALAASPPAAREGE